MFPPSTRLDSACHVEGVVLQQDIFERNLQEKLLIDRAN